MAEFQPIWNEDTLRGVIDQYKTNPSGYPENLRELIKEHAGYYNVPFYEGDFSIADALGDLGKGFFAGFTTYDAFEPPDNEYEAVFRNIGHLAGFAPGIISAPLSAAGKLVKSRGLLKAAQFARKLNDKSVPMMAANFATKHAKKVARPIFLQGGKAKHDAVNTVSNFLLGHRAKHIAEGAFHLGVASSVSSWQGGIDAMMSSFVHGGVAGGVFRGIGNFINTGSESGTKVARTLAGSLFMGLPETVRGATTPEQVYAYMMGAWFGGKEKPWTEAKAMKFQNKYIEDATKEGAPDALRLMRDPEIHPDWKNLPEEVKPIAKELFENTFKTKAQNEAALLYAAEQFGLDLKKLDIDIKTPEGKKAKIILERMRKLEMFETEDKNEGSLNDTDVGGKPTEELTLGKRVDNIFIKYMDKVKNPILKDIESLDDKVSKKNEITKKINLMLNPYLKENTGIATNESQAFVKEMQEMLLKDYNYQIDSKKIPQLSGDIRQWISMRNNKKPMPVLTTDGTTVERLTRKNSKNRAGNKKVEYEPYKLIDLLYQNLTGKEEWGHTHLDHLVINDKKGGKKELDLTQFFKEPTRKDDYGGKSDYMDVVSNTMKIMDKQGFYYFGGNGAKKKLLLTRYHPNAKNIKMSEITDFFNSVNLKRIKNRFIRDFNMTSDYFDKAFKSNVLWALEMNGMKFTSDNMLKILSPEFILHAVDFNKRNQIWMTDSYPGEKEFFTNKNSDGYVSDLSKDGNFRYSVFPDFYQDMPKEMQDKMKKDSANLDKKSNEMPEHFDGGPIVRDDIINKLNLDAGTPESGQNKAFIISPDAGKGALLGKLMFHSAGKAQSEQMKKDGVHFYLPKSAVKQMGIRDYFTNYELDPSHIRYNYGVKQGPEFLKPQTLKKQIMTNLVSRLAFNSKLPDGTDMTEIVEDMYKNIIQPRYRGEKESNEALDAYYEKLPTASDKELAETLDTIDFDKVGLPKIITGLNKQGNQLFVKKAYDMMLINKKDSLKEELESGDISDEQYKSSVNELEEYNSLADKMIASARREAKKRGKPLNQVSIFTHHFINNFRKKVLKSWIERQAIKPKIANSGVARIRPYDYALQTDADKVNSRLKDLNTNDSLFFLDKAYEDMRIDTDLYGEKRLVELWDIYQDKKTPKDAKKYLETVFRSGVMRVPMDSASGMQVLKFSGFTGRKGHGVLMHSRAMRKLGGADLDGDTAYFYMGGKGGFKESWKDMFEAQSKEFDENGRLSNAKSKKYEDLLTEKLSPNERKIVKSKEGLFSPNLRFNASHSSMTGRELLGGGAVVPKQIMGAAYQMISKKGSETFSWTDRFDNIHEFTLTPKTSESAKKEIAKLSRAATGISADSSNYYGYKDYNTWYMTMLDAHFNVGYAKNGKKMSRFLMDKLIDKLGTSVFRYNGTIGMLGNANRAIHGKDYTNNRQWTMEERRNLSKDIDNIPNEDIETITPKITKLLNGIDYSDNAIRKLNPQKMKDLFDLYNESISRYNYLLKALGRDTFAIKTGKYINKTITYELNNSDKLLEIADIDNPSSNDKFWDIIRGTPYEYVRRKGVKRGGLYQRKIEKAKDLAEYNTTEERIRVLNNIKETAGDFIMKDIENLVSVSRIARIARKIEQKNPDMSKDALNKILADAHRHSEWLKINSYLMRDSRNQGDRDVVLANKKRVKTKGTKELDQNEIDFEIRKWKRNRSKLEKQLFDEFMLGSLNRGNIRKMEALKAKGQKNLTTKESLELEGLREDAARTSSSRLGYESEALEKGSMDKFLGDMNDVFNEVSEQRAPEHIRAEGTVLVEEPQKIENIVKGFPEKPNKDLEDRFVNTTGWEGIKKFKKGELDAETKSYIDDIVTHLKTENNKVSQNFNYLTRALLEKDINLMNNQDWGVMKNWFDNVKTGTIWQRLKKGELFTKLSQRHYILFPETVNREIMKDEIVLIQKEGLFLTKEGMRIGKIAKPTQFIDYIQDGIRETNEAALGMGDEVANNLSKKLLFLDRLEDGNNLQEVAVATRQFGEIKRIMSREGDQNVKWADAQTYQKLHDNIMKTSDYENSLKDKIYNITLEDGTRVSESGREVVKRINETYDNYFDDMRKLATGNVKTDAKGNILKTTTKAGEEVYVIPDSILEGIEGFTSGPKGSGYIKVTKEFPTGFYDPLTRQNPVINISKFANDLRVAWAKGNPIPKEFGIDGVNKIVRSMIIEMAGKSKEFTEKDLKRIQTSSSPPTGRIPNYWPHMHFNKKTALDALSQYSKHLRQSDLTEKETNDILKKLTYRHHALTGDWNFKDIDNMQEFEGVLSGISDAQTKKDRKINWMNNLNKPGSTQLREAHIPGYSLDRQVPITYGKSLVNSYFRQIAQVFSRDGIEKFEKSMFKRNVDKEQRDAWTTWTKLYVQGAIGNPDVIPEHILNDPKMKIKGTPYAWFADNVVRDRVNSIGDKLGLIKKDLPENLRGLDLSDLKWWSNLEAKFELASLLAHPKSVVNNIFGGTMHTIESIGFRNWKNARNNKFMASINPEWATKEGRDKTAVKAGIFPEQLMEEYGLNTAYQSVKNEKFIKDVAKAMTKDPSLSSESVIDMAKRAGIGAEEKITRVAAKFMSIPERALRRDAYMAHWLFWYNKFGGAIKDFDHPILVELAKKGVKATQFLYSAPFRPMFARTALGKVMSRFQLWGWNAVRFRNDTLREAKIYGFKGAEGEKAARMMQMDLMVFAFGNAFAYSLFDTAMPAPWNWMQDTSEWLFGDEKERNRAFFGQWPRTLAPLQTITPPILRLPMASMRAVLEDDWERVANYYIHTMYPFGRISRDFIGENNLIDNPHGFIDKWTGLPFIELSKLSKKKRKREEEGEEIYKFPTPGSSLF